MESEDEVEVRLLDNLTLWMIRRAGEIITKCSDGSDGKIACKRIGGQPCRRPIVQFGESLLYPPLGALATDESKIEENMGDVIWLVVDEQAEGDIIGTA